jgi:hypothetical protein
MLYTHIYLYEWTQSVPSENKREKKKETPTACIKLMLMLDALKVELFAVRFSLCMYVCMWIQCR